METGNNDFSIETLAREIRAIYRVDGPRAESSIEDFLRDRLRGHPPGERMSVVRRLAREFQEPPPEDLRGIGLDQKEFSLFCSLLLGRSVSTADLSSAEVMERLALSLNTVFDTLNKTIALIHSTLMGRKGELETIRHIIGSDIQRAEGAQSLQGYLDQVQEAFLVAHRGFQQAARVEVEKILSALNPARIAAADESVFRFGPLRKAEYFEIYKEKYRTVKDWFDSGRFTEELLREFESICGKEYGKQRRETP